MLAARNGNKMSIGRSDFHRAGGTETWRALLDSITNAAIKKEVLTQQSEDEWTALMCAACNGNTETCMLFLDQLGSKGNYPGSAITNKRYR